MTARRYRGIAIAMDSELIPQITKNEALSGLSTYVTVGQSRRDFVIVSPALQCRDSMLNHELTTL